ncbi:plasmid pRiA4b ORF-3 family protein [Nocardiopsis exhalans]|uniref:Plasmid pRiA4b ORF-3 family protein n=1 Tax=Nocardiopsis exhalans TaxID=163604 RepID=A0ABY5DEV3_9ACTN|nr:plasmid pRiA4b ORF-3 family protein [Nocardiopsis exhalans]USY22470.1 plasmid pRiA4b ORF-3 family protein [Nocardiopsis exhalans]
MSQKSPENRVYRLKIVLEGTEPPVWRLVEVPAGLRLSHLHVVIQTVMGWEHAHPHAFEFGKRHYSEGGGGFGGDLDEFEARVGEVLSRKGSKGVYTYDFGDDWRHLIVVEATGEAAPDTFYPRVLDGHGGGPPEDCGGVDAFERLRRLREHPEERGRDDHSVTGEQLMWVESLEPDELDLELIQDDLWELFEGAALGGGGEEPSPARPVTLPPEEELAAAALQTSPLRELLALARWVSYGIKLTGTGVPRPADIRAAVGALDLWPHACEAEAEERAERVRKLRSARGLPEFLDLWDTAVALGLIEVSSARAHTCAELLVSGPTPGRVLEWWTELFGSTIEGSFGGDGTGSVGADPLFGEVELFYLALRMLYEAPDEFEADLAELVRTMAAGAEEDFEELDLAADPTPAEEFGDTGAASKHAAGHDGFLSESVLEPLYLMMHEVAEVGAVRLVDATSAEVREAVLEQNPFGLSAPPSSAIDCLAVLTPLGRYGVRQYLLGTGIPAPLTEEVADADAAGLLDMLSTTPPELHPTVTAPWLAARTPQEAVREIAEAAADLTGLGALRRALASGVLGSAGEEVVPELRSLLGSDRRTVTALAAGALLSRPERPQEEAEALNEEYGLWLAIDRMSGPLELGEENFVALLGLDTGEGSGPIEQLLFERGEQLWKVDHPATAEVLEALGRLHPDKTAAKAARRAARKARSQG